MKDGRGLSGHERHTAHHCENFKLLKADAEEDEPAAGQEEEEEEEEEEARSKK